MRNSIGCKQRPRPARTAKGVRTAELLRAQGTHGCPASCWDLRPLGLGSSSLLCLSWLPHPNLYSQRKEGQGLLAPRWAQSCRAEWAARPGRLLFPSERSLAVPAAPATSSRQAAACRAASSPRPERPPSPAQGRSCQPRGPADTLGAGRARPVAALPCSGPLSSPAGIRGTVGVARAPCCQRSGMCSGRMLKP